MFLCKFLSNQSRTTLSFAGPALELDVRPELMRIKIKDNTFQTTGDQASSKLLSLVEANGIAILPGSSDSRKLLEKGDNIEVIHL